VETEQTSKGYTFTSGSPLQTEVTRKYDDVLPSLNLVYDFSDSLLMRVGAAKVMTRPSLGQLNPGSSVSVSGNSRSVTAGNPDLEPFRADAYDLGFEWYFASESILSVALFYKDIESFVQTIARRVRSPATRWACRTASPIAACGTTPGCSPSADWDFSCRPTPGRRTAGLRNQLPAAVQLPARVWSNFGAILNYTGVESEIDYLNSAGAVIATDDLTGLSKSAYNATLYYDNKTFSARISAAYRSDYLTTVPGRDGNDVEGTASTLNIDFSSLVQRQRPLHAVARGAEPHRRSAGPVGGLESATACRSTTTRAASTTWVRVSSIVSLRAPLRLIDESRDRRRVCPFFLARVILAACMTARSVRSYSRDVPCSPPHALAAVATSEPAGDTSGALAAGRTRRRTRDAHEAFVERAPQGPLRDRYREHITRPTLTLFPPGPSPMASRCSSCRAAATSAW
jgi:hypothetical protein